MRSGGGGVGTWHPLVENIRLWFLAKAQVEIAVAIHAVHDVINHHHTRVTPSEDNLPRFTRVVHGETSKALNALLAHERYDAPGEIFDDRQTHRMRLLDAEAMASHHVYEHLNTVAAGLVARPEHMPGLKLSHDRWRTPASCRSTSRRTRSSTGPSTATSTR